MKTTKEVQNILRSKLPELKKLGVKRIGIFGSYVRGEQKEDSDIDILVEFIEGEETYDNLFGINDLLRNIFDMEVEIVTMGGLSPYIGPHILREVVFIDKASA